MGSREPWLSTPTSFFHATTVSTIHVCTPSLTSLTSLTPSPPLLHCLPATSFIHHCPHSLAASLVTSLLHPPALHTCALAHSSMCVCVALMHVLGVPCEMAVGYDAGWWWVWVKDREAMGGQHVHQCKAW